MERNNYMPMLLNEFQMWYERKHRRNEDSYKNLIVKTKLSALSKIDFIGFFYKFIENRGSTKLWK